MRRWRFIGLLGTLTLPAWSNAQPTRGVDVQAGGRAGMVIIDDFSSLTYGAATSLVWREPVPRLDVRAELAVERGGSAGTGCVLFTSSCARVETRASLTTAALTVARRLKRGVYIPGEQRTYLFMGGALLSGHVTDDIGATAAGCTFFFACFDAQPAHTERHPVRRAALTGGASFDARLRRIDWFGEVRYTFAAGAHAETMTVGLRF